MTTLRRCRVVWGTAERIAALPRLRTIADATYVPAQPDGRWGLFGPDGASIEAGGGAEDETGNQARAFLPGPIETAPDGAYLYVGPMVTHFGHFLLGTVSRLWPLLASGAPRPRLVCHSLGPRGDWEALDAVTQVLARFDLPAADVISFDRPTRLPRVTVPDASLKEQAFAHAVYGDLARAIGRPFWEAATADTVSRPVYLSKARLASGISRMRNEDALCDALARRGVDIVFPETLSFGEQVRLLAERRIVLGTTGSAFHASVFSAPGRRIVGLNWAPHINANFTLTDVLNGNLARYYHPVGTRSAPAAGFHFDWAVPDADAVASELLWRAERIDRLDALDAAEEAAERRAERGPLLPRIGRWLRRPPRP